MRQNSQDIPLGPKEAEELIRARKEGRIKLYDRKDGKIVINHVATANAMAMFLVNVPMPKIFKKVLLMRIGSPLVHKKSMSHMAIALQLGMNVAEVHEIEAEALRICNDFMSRSSGHMFAGQDNKGLVTDTMNELVNQDPGQTPKGEEPQ